MGSGVVSSAGEFINSIGVNTHINSGWSQWMDVSTLGAELSFLGISHVRDGTPYEWAMPVYDSLARQGIKFDLTQSNPTSGPLSTIDSSIDALRAAALEQAVPNSVESLEGANEYNLWGITLNGVSSYNNFSWGEYDASDLKAAVRAQPILNSVYVVAPSTALALAIPPLGSSVDGSNWHSYGGVGQQLADSISNGIAAAQASAPGKPVFITETGISSSGYGSSFWGVADEYTQSVIEMNALFDAFAGGAFRTFLYELMDEPSKVGQEGAFGLFHADGTPKPIALALHRSVALLSASNASNSGLATPQYFLGGLPDTASSMLLRRSDGGFDLIVWNGRAIVSDGQANVLPPTSQVKLSLNAAANLVAYDPVAGNVQAASTMATTISFDLSADPVIVSIDAPTDIAVPVQISPPPTEVVPLQISSPSTEAVPVQISPRPTEVVPLQISSPSTEAVPVKISSPTITEAVSASNDATRTVYRFWLSSNGEHFYTSKLSEVNTLLATRPEFKLEDATLNSVTLGSDPDAVPVFRFMDTITGSHFFTSNASERDNLIAMRADMQYEGLVFAEHSTGHAGDAAVYRFFDGQNGDHLYTTSLDERASIIAMRPDMHYEGIAFFAPESP